MQPVSSVQNIAPDEQGCYLDPISCSIQSNPIQALSGWTSIRYLVYTLALITTGQLAAAAATKPAETFKIVSTKSKIAFTVMRGEHVGARGNFTGIAGTIIYDRSHPSASVVNAFIPLSTIETGVAVRDTDLVGPKYFDCAKFPRATFRSTRITTLKGGKMIIDGTLNLHGIKKAVRVELLKPPKIVSSKAGKGALLARGRSSLNQSDFGLSLLALHPDGAVRINPKITLEITIDAQK